MAYVHRYQRTATASGAGGEKRGVTLFFCLGFLYYDRAKRIPVLAIGQERFRDLLARDQESFPGAPILLGGFAVHPNPEVLYALQDKTREDWASFQVLAICHFQHSDQREQRTTEDYITGVGGRQMEVDSFDPLAIIAGAGHLAESTISDSVPF